MSVHKGLVADVGLAKEIAHVVDEHVHEEGDECADGDTLNGHVNGAAEQSLPHV